MAQNVAQTGPVNRSAALAAPGMRRHALGRLARPSARGAARMPVRLLAPMSGLPTMNRGSLSNNPCLLVRASTSEDQMSNEEHHSRQIALLAMVPIAMMSLKWAVSTGPHSLFFPAALLALPIAGPGLRQLLAEGFSMAVRCTSWVQNHRAPPAHPSQHGHGGHTQHHTTHQHPPRPALGPDPRMQQQPATVAVHYNTPNNHHHMRPAPGWAPQDELAPRYMPGPAHVQPARRQPSPAPPTPHPAAYAQPQPQHRPVAMHAPPHQQGFPPGWQPQQHGGAPSQQQPASPRPAPHNAYGVSARPESASSRDEGVAGASRDEVLRSHMSGDDLDWPAVAEPPSSHPAPGPHRAGSPPHRGMMRSGEQQPWAGSPGHAHPRARSHPL